METTLKIGILGAGRLGQTLARLLVKAGYRVKLANSRNPHSLASLVKELGTLASAGTAKAVFDSSDIVIIATRWEQTPAAVRELGPLNGKIVVDATNNRFGPGAADLYDLGGLTSSEVVAALVPGARLVKAFNHQPILELASLPDSYSGAERKALFIAGDDADAKQIAAQIIRDIGGEPVDTGNLRDGGLLQGTGGALAGFGRLLDVSEAQSLLAKLQKGAVGSSDKKGAANIKN